jgi:hypothetical protein
MVIINGRDDPGILKKPIGRYERPSKRCIDSKITCRSDSIFPSLFAHHHSKVAFKKCEEQLNGRSNIEK